MTHLAGTVGGVRALAGLGILLVALIGAGLALHVPGADSVGSVGLTNSFVAILGVAGAAYLASVWLVLRRPSPRRSVWLVLGVALAMRLPALAGPPFLSSDLFRYIWDGRVQEAGINPYRYIPADPALEALRDQAIYPHVNRREYAPTIYPPMAQALFQLIARISQTPLAVKLAMVGFEMLAVGCLIRLLALAGLPLARVLIYAWNPLAVWTFAGNGHVDGAVVGLIGLALLARGLRRDGWAGAALGGAVLLKFLPLALAPALWRRWNWRFVAAFLAVVGGLYAAYSDAGWRVFGFLPAYGREEGIGQGGGIWLLAGLGNLVPLPDLAGRVYLALAALGLGGLGAWIAFRTRWPTDPGEDIVRVCAASAILAGCTMAALSPHYPWYFVWLAVPACLAPYRSVIWLSVAPLVLYLDPLHERFIWPSLVYVPCLVLAWVDLRRHPAGRIVAAPRAIRSS